jgi:hypothetical protein
MCLYWEGRFIGGFVDLKRKRGGAAESMRLAAIID